MFLFKCDCGHYNAGHVWSYTEVTYGQCGTFAGHRMDITSRPLDTTALLVSGRPIITNLSEYLLDTYRMLT